MTEYSFKNLSQTIESIINYKINSKKRKADGLTNYNADMEILSKCLGPLMKLEALIGMDSIKTNIVDQVLFYAQRLNTDEMMHMCLTGPPGVGKTTVGKILSEIYSNLGFLSTNKFRVVSRTELIAGYLGQTALKTLKVLTEAKGGVLFIDEAYSLGGNKDEEGNSYSKECIDTINKFLSENTSDFIMIIAGYKEEMDRYFFSINKGLRRRFPWVYDIKEYSIDNLRDIFVYQVEVTTWKFENEIRANKYSMLNKLFTENKDLFKDNGGDTLVLFDKAKICHSRRVFGKYKRFKKILSIADINSAIELLKALKTDDKKQTELPFGMYL